MSINSFLNQSISLKIIIVTGLFWAIVAAIGVYYFFGGVKEGFQAGLVGLGSALDYKMGDGVKRSWENNSVAENSATNMKLNMQPATPNGDDNDTVNVFSDLEKNEGGLVPLPEDELLFFSKNKFSPECCPSSYSNADGCVCASPEQMKYLSERGGNRTLYDQF
jgi:hypothetical protein